MLLLKGDLLENIVFLAVVLGLAGACKFTEIVHKLIFYFFLFLKPSTCLNTKTQVFVHKDHNIIIGVPDSKCTCCTKLSENKMCYINASKVTPPTPSPSLFLGG